MLKIIGANGNLGRRLLEKSVDEVEVITTRLDQHQLDYDQILHPFPLNNYKTISVVT